jgi:hypothetical protein
LKASIVSPEVRAELMRSAPDSELGARVDEINAVPAADVERMLEAPRHELGLKLLHDAEAAVPELKPREEEIMRRAAAIAALAGSDSVNRIHIAEALSYEPDVVFKHAQIGVARSIAADLKPGEPAIGKGYSWRERSVLGNDVPKGGMVLDMRTPEGNREFVFNKRGEFVAGPLGVPEKSPSVRPFDKADFKAIGETYEGHPLFQRDDGMRYYLKNGHAFAQQVERGGPAEGGPRTSDFLTKEEFRAKAGNPLDLGEAVDPAIAERQRQQVALGAEAPQRAPGDVDQLGEIGLPLMDAADQHTFRLSEEGGEISAEDLLKEIADDEKAVKDIKDCL